MRRAWALVIAILPLTIVPAQQARRDQELFRRIFGAEVCRFDPAAVAKLKTLPPGTRSETRHEWRRKNRHHLFHRYRSQE